MECVLILGQVFAWMAPHLFLRSDWNGINSFILFYFIVVAVRFIPLCAAMFSGPNGSALANPKKQKAAIYFLISIT